MEKPTEGTTSIITFVKTKMCWGCKNWLPLSRYSKNMHVRLTHKQARCRKCMSLARKAFYAKNKDKIYQKRVVKIENIPDEAKKLIPVLNKENV